MKNYKDLEPSPTDMPSSCRRACINLFIDLLVYVSIPREADESDNIKLVLEKIYEAD